MKKKKEGKLHISHIQRAVAFMSMMYKATLESLYAGNRQTHSLNEAGVAISKVHHLMKAWAWEREGKGGELRYWTEGSQVLNQSLTEVSAQSG